MTGWLDAFLLTQVVEVPIYLLALARLEPRRPARLAVAFGASAVTHPFVWFVIPDLVYAAWNPLPGSYAVLILLAESFAVGVEAGWLRAFGLRRALLWALGANMASFGAGQALRLLIGWP